MTEPKGGYLTPPFCLSHNTKRAAHNLPAPFPFHMEITHILYLNKHQSLTCKRRMDSAVIFLDTVKQIMRVVGNKTVAAQCPGPGFGLNEARSGDHHVNPAAADCNEMIDAGIFRLYVAAGCVPNQKTASYKSNAFRTYSFKQRSLARSSAYPYRCNPLLSTIISPSFTPISPAMYSLRLWMPARLAGRPPQRSQERK